MTTLPQTAGLRLPRPATGSLPMSMQFPYPGFVAPAGPPAAAMSGADVWRVIRSNFWLILLMLVVSGGAGFAMNSWLKKYHSRYTAVGTVEANVGDIDADGNTRHDSEVLSIPLEVRKDATLLKNGRLLTELLENANSEVRTTSWYNRFTTPYGRKQDLKDELDINFAPDSKLIEISMTDNDPKSAQVIVQSLVDQYIKDQQDRNQDLQYKSHQQLEQQEIAEEGKLKLVNGDIADIQAELNSEGVNDTISRIDTKGIQLQALLEGVQKLSLEEKGYEEQYSAMVAQIDNGEDPPEVLALIDQDKQVDMDRTIESNYEFSEAQALNGNMGADSPQMMAVERNKAMIDQKLAKDVNQARERYKTQLLETLRQKISMDKAEIESMNGNVKSINSEMAQLTTWMEQLLEKQSEQDSIQKKIKVLDDQLDQIAAYDVAHAYAGVQWAAQPEFPDEPSFPKLGVVMAMCIAMGLVLALAIAFLREYLDTSIRSPRDISRVGNMNLLGMVPHEDDDPQSAGARLPVVIFEAPHSMMAEQLRQVRTRLQHSSSLDTTRTILITSPSPGDGKSTIACNLAAGLALNGRRILLVDANFRRPELHRVFNLANEQGFSDVLNSIDLFSQAVQETQVPNLFVLPSGHKPTNATELVESQLLVDFIERCLEDYDHVIFDSGPLLFVSETVGLAPRVDGVVTVVRARINTRGVLSRMRDTLRQVKAEHLGVVLNAVRAQGGGYYGRNIRTYYEYQKGDGRAA
jgi:polysaccharide biosynthesis transport protein